MMYSIGVDIGGSHIKVGLVREEDGKLLARDSARFPHGMGEQAVWNQVQALVRNIMGTGLAAPDLIQSLGVALPGALDRRKNRVINAYNLHFSDVNIRQPLLERFPDFPLYILNDADAATLAEHRFGVLQGAKTAVLLTLGTGLGGGLIIGGRLFGGGMGNGVEPGHMTLKYDGPRDSCGNRGCAELYCSARALVIPGVEDSTPGKTIEAISSGEEAALKQLDCYTDALSSAIVSITNLLDPEIIALGGGIVHAGEALIRMTGEKVKEKSFFKQAYRIVAASMGNEAGIVGAALAHAYLDLA